MKILLFVIAMTYVLIMYGVMYFDGKRKERYIFGVTLWDGADEEYLKQAERKYKKDLRWILAVMTAVSVAMMMPQKSAAVLVIFLTEILITTIVFFVPFAVMNKRLMRKKYSEVLPKEKIVKIEMEAALSKEPVPFKKIGVAGLAASLVPVVLEIVTGRHESMEGKEYFLFGMIVAVVVICFVMHLVMNRMRVEVISENSAVNVQINRVKKYQTGRVLAVLGWMTAVFNMALWLITDEMPGREMVMAAIILVYEAVIVASAVVCQKNISKVEKMYAEEITGDGQDDRNWIWGMFYCNKDDKRMMVPKRIGTGGTINLATVGGKIVSAVTIVMLFGSVGWALVSILEADMSKIKLRVGDGYVEGEHIETEFVIKTEDMEEVRYEEGVPKVSKISGVSMDGKRCGKFRTGDGRIVYMCMSDKSKGYIVIAANEKLYYLNDEDGDTYELFMKIEEERKEERK